MSIPTSVLNFIGNVKDLNTLYQNPLFSISILRLLDDDSTAFIFDLLLVNLNLNSIKSLPNIKETLNTLLSVNLIKKIENNIFLDPNFRSALLKSFCMKNFDQKFTPTTFNKPFHEISAQKIHKILEFIASNTKIDLFGIENIVIYCQLKDQSKLITNKGFEFLLLPRKDQLWFLIINSIKFYSKNSLEDFDMLISVMEILLKPTPGPYIAENHLDFYSILDSLGVIIIVGYSNNKNPIFYVNNTILYDINTSNSSNISNKFIVLETNFKIYAYTGNSYDKSVLSLFSTTINVFPNLVKACFDEESVLSAFNKGITAKQIIKYLQDHSEEVPRNVSNQINIWEQKLHRIRTRNGYLYHDFIHLSDFYKVLKYIKSIDGLIYQDEQKRMIVGEERTHDMVKDYIKDSLQ